MLLKRKKVIVLKIFEIIINILSSSELDTPEKPDEIKWSFKICTSDLGSCDEGTDSKVYATLIGSKGKSSKFWLKLDHKVNFYFEPGTQIVLEQICEDIGDLEMLEIEQDGSGIAPDWHLNKVSSQNELILPNILSYLNFRLNFKIIKQWIGIYLKLIVGFQVKKAIKS